MTIRKVTLAGLDLSSPELSWEEKVALAKAYARQVVADAAAGRTLQRDDVVDVSYIEEETITCQCCCVKETEELKGGCNE
jgi:hypothetical protein